MKKLFLLLLLLPLLGRGLGGGLLSAQNVTVSNLVVTEGTPTTVTFNVSWNRPADPAAVWMDSAWVFVDYNKNGVMTRLPLLLESGATLTYTSAPGEGKVEEVPGNDRGMWVRGYARTNWSFSARVMLLTNETNVAGACAYASGYPPVGQYVSESEIVFTGTPWYELKLEHTDGNVETIESGGTFLLPCSYTVSSFTDATGAPGVFNCLPSVDIYDLTASATAFCTGDAVTFALSNTTAGRTYQLYKNGVAVDALTGTGSAETFTGTFAGAGTYTARVDAKGIYCAAQMTGTHVIAENTPPSAPANLMSNVMAICDGTSTSATLTASGGSMGSGAVYEWGTGSTVGDNLITATAGNTCSVSLSEAITCWVRLRGAGVCSAVTTGGMTVSIAANTPPSAPTDFSSNVTVICRGMSTPATLTAIADVGSDIVYEWGRGNTVGSTRIATTTANTYSVTLSSATTYWLQLRGTGACSTTTAGGMITTIAENTPPSSAPSALSSNLTTICDGTPTTITLTATGGSMGSGAVYEWGESNTVGDNPLTTTTESTYTVAPSAATTYWVRLRGIDACSAATTSGRTRTIAAAMPPTAPTDLSSNVAVVCTGLATSVLLTATADVGSGARYEWGTGSIVGSGTLSPSTTTAATRSVATTAATTYWVRLRGTSGACSATITEGVTTSIAAYPAISPGSITSGAVSTLEGINPSATITNVAVATGGGGNPTYMWVRTGTSSATLTGSGTTYSLSADAAGNYGTAGTYRFNRYARDETCTRPVAAAGTYTLTVDSPSTLTLCTKCCYSGSAWVDCHVTTHVYPFNTAFTNTSVTWAGGSTYYYTGAKSDRNGRANTAAITGSTPGSAVQICKDLGTGWYLPAYEELYNMCNTSWRDALAPLNGLEGADLLDKPGIGFYWASSEWYENRGRCSINGEYTDAMVYAVTVREDATCWNYGEKDTRKNYVVCVKQL